MPAKRTKGKSREASSMGRVPQTLGFWCLMAASFLIGLYLIGPALNRPGKEAGLSAPDLRPGSSSSLSPEGSPKAGQAGREIVSAVEVTVARGKTLATSPAPRQQPVDNGAPDQSILPKGNPPVTPATVQTAGVVEKVFRVHAGSFDDEQTAKGVAEQLTTAGFAPNVIRQDAVNGVLFEVQLGKFHSEENAQKVAESVRATGVEAYVVEAE